MCDLLSRGMHGQFEVAEHACGNSLQTWCFRLESTPLAAPLVACSVRVGEPEVAALPERVPRVRSPEPSGAAPA